MNNDCAKYLASKIAICLLLMSTISWAEMDNFIDWKLKSSKDNIEIYNRHVGNMPTLMFKTIATIDEPIDKVVSVLVDLERRNQWEPFFGSGKVIREVTPYDRIEYWHSATPKPILKDREFIVNTKAWVDQPSNTLIFQFKSVDYPYQSGFNRVRAKLYESSFALTPLGPNKTKIVYILHVDPMGWCPKWIIRIVQEGYPRGFVLKVREYIAKQNIKVDPLAQKLTDQLLPVKPQ